MLQFRRQWTITTKNLKTTTDNQKGIFKLKSFKYTITDPVGIHARPAGVLVRKSDEFESSITVEDKGQKVDMSKLLALMNLDVKCGDTVTVKITGSDEEKAASEIENLFKEIL